MASRIPKIYNFAGKRSDSSGTEDDDLAVVTNAADDGTGSDSPTPVAQPSTGASFRLPNSTTIDDDEKVVNVCKYFFFYTRVGGYLEKSLRCLVLDILRGGPS